MDGREHGVATPDEVAPWPWVFDSKPFHLILNVAVGGMLGGDVVRDDLPATVDVDWVRVYPARLFGDAVSGLRGWGAG